MAAGTAMRPLCSSDSQRRCGVWALEHNPAVKAVRCPCTQSRLCTWEHHGASYGCRLPDLWWLSPEEAAVMDGEVSTQLGEQLLHVASPPELLSSTIKLEKRCGSQEMLLVLQESAAPQDRQCPRKGQFLPCLVWCCAPLHAGSHLLSSVAAFP